jgi:hypothetical protein
MKLLITLLTLTSFVFAQQDRLIVLPEKTEKPAPLFFSASADISATATTTETTSTQSITYTIHQGIPEVLTLGLSGAGEITSVTGNELKDWSVRIAKDGSRFLDVRPNIADPKNSPKNLSVQVTTKLVGKNEFSLLVPTPASTTGFSAKILLTPAPGIEIRVSEASNLSPIESKNTHSYVTTGNAALKFSANHKGLTTRGLELINSSLTGTLSKDSNSITFTLAATARSKSPNSSIEFLSGSAALSGKASGTSHHIALNEKNGYDLIADTTGDFPIEVQFVVPISRKGDWHLADFSLPAGIVVPLTLDAIPDKVSFNPNLSVAPRKNGNAWRGFLPANGKAQLAFKPATETEDGSLFFTSQSITDNRIGSGLMRQITQIDLRVLQGKIPNLSLSLNGPGEILSIVGESVLAWTVSGEKESRKIEIKLSRPIEGGERITIESQAALGGFPLEMQALRIAPIGSLRHSGFVRYANDGAVRIEVADAKGLIQLAPNQFPGGANQALRQALVYRFPSSEFSAKILADQILPEVGVTEVTVYELAETDRRIISNIELDIREAPLRELEMKIPGDHAVAAVTGATVADYAVSSDIKDGLKTLKIIFSQAVDGRQLISLRLEKNEAAKAAPWILQPLGFNDVKSRRGYIGASATAGYRLVAGKNSGLAEVPVTFFPRKTQGLQQAFRLRENTWTAELTIEALGQSIQADVFHLYSLKAGAAYGSVLVNYFVVGAPANEWKISVPASIGNIDVTGQNVGRDWRREGDTVIIPLSRPLLGAGTVLLTFEQPMPANGGELSPGEVRPLNVQAERGHIQVVSPLQVKFSTELSEGPLLKIDPSELPAEFRLLSSAPTLAAWQYTSREFKIGSKIEWYEHGETVDQVVDFLKLSTQVSRDGQWVTDASFFVKSKGRASLRLLLPSDTSLWEARVDGEPVNARADGKDTLIPLPAQPDPNRAFEITLRYGAKSTNSSKPRLTAPSLDAPLVIGEWTVTGDENRTLVATGGDLQSTSNTTQPSGWKTLSNYPVPLAVLILLGIISAFFSREGLNSAARFLPATATIAFILIALLLALKIFNTPTYLDSELSFNSPVVPAGNIITLEISNLTQWQARAGLNVWMLLILGTTLTIYAIAKKHNIMKAIGLALVGASFLSYGGGAPLFCLALALLALISTPWRLIASNVLKIFKKAPTVAALLILTAALTQNIDAQDLKPAESITQSWVIKENRLQASMEISLRAQQGDRFLLLKAPATLTYFNGSGLKVHKEAMNPGAQNPESYIITAESSGLLTATATFEMPMNSPVNPWQIPTGSAALSQISLRYDQAGWEFFSDAAAQTSPFPDLAATESGAMMTLSPGKDIAISARPAQRDISSEETKFFAEVSNLFLPGPGVVNGIHRISIRPSQGRISSIILSVQDGFTVSDVANGPVGTWRFDPKTKQLRIPIEPAQSSAFDFTVSTQRSAASIPFDLTLAPIRVNGAAGEIGFLAMAFGNDSQPESVTPKNLSRVNAGDFDSKLLPRDKEGNPLALLQHAFRYGSEDASLNVKITEVAPELRSESWQLISLGDDRLVVSTDLSVNITRAGVFKLSIEIPADLEIETATGGALSHWTESTTDGKRILTLHLNGKTMGVQNFNITLTGRPPGSQNNWEVPRLMLKNASRETGIVTVVPDRGLQVRAVNRKNISQESGDDIQALNKQAAQASTRPGALTYRILQSDWSLGLAISRLDPWVTAKVFHESTLREGQTVTRASIQYRIENAAIKSLRVRIPNLDITSASTVRANGADVADLIPIEGQDGLYEIRFQRGIAGETVVELEYQQSTKNTGTENITAIIFEDVRQLSYFAAIRAGGRLELDTPTLPRGWQRDDWAAAQAAIGQAAGNTAPLLLFRVADAEGPLTVTIKRHELENLEKLRVSAGSLTTLISPHGDYLTAVDLSMQVTSKSTLRLKLPDDSKLFNVLVNDEAATLVREKSEWLFYIFPSPAPNQPANVRFVYSSKNKSVGKLQGPSLNVPLENLTWNVIIPEGYRMVSHKGDFDKSGESSYGTFDLEDYKSFAINKKQNDSQSAVILLDQAVSWAAKGDQEKAAQCFSNAVRNGNLDAASGEDARVQLRELKTQQAVLGLNTRRQKLTLDNKSSATPNDNAQLQEAANANPILQGYFNYDPNQFDSFLAGNSADENTALKDIANRIVLQQLAAEPAPQALDITLPERGNVISFTRSVQVDGNGGEPMSITLGIRENSSNSAWLAIPLCLLLGAIGVRRKA